VTVHDVVQDGGQIFIVMELVEAPNLEQVVARQGPLPAARVAGVGLEVLAALEAAHRAGIVHRGNSRG
jgi:serine/threonine protein kinase